ncbi:hypothetical protein ITX31_08295 [Arthrobacter gandavensis]|uniref:Rv3654c family TadE-like protein n=1 Tax=Arthrobacter gandavensis TaxID=169960 RepID=UPI00188E5C3B|nr:Rv3654c family TadE-like protein [Arthrobacter gandavensis]MBF4994110.1 hypothetical protein [Arthrobacter gandavensis]
MMNRGHCRASVDGDTGSGTVLMLGIVLGVITLAVAAVLLASAVVSGARAGTAANLAALAGADALRGLRSADPCTLAAAVAERNRGQMVQCVPDLQSRTVTVSVHTAAGLLPWPAAAEARAGPPPVSLAERG